MATDPIVGVSSPATFTLDAGSEASDAFRMNIAALNSALSHNSEIVAVTKGEILVGTCPP